MALVRELRRRPEPWAKHAARYRGGLRVLRGIEYGCEWTAYALGHWAFLEVLEYLGTFSVLIAVVFYFSESGDRKKQKHYQAWQVINTAQGKGGSGGRIEALNELNHDRVPLVGVDVSRAFLMGVRLDGAELVRSNFQAADVRGASFRGARLDFSNLVSANFRDCDFEKARLENANLKDADLFGAKLAGANLEAADLTQADLRTADLRGIVWKQIGGIKLANVFAVRNAPAGFLEWAKANGAVELESDEAWFALLPQS